MTARQAGDHGALDSGFRRNDETVGELLTMALWIPAFAGMTRL